MALSQRTDAHQVVAPSFELGPLRIKDLPVLATDLHRLEGLLGLRPDGIVGLDVLLGKCFRVETTGVV